MKKITFSLGILIFMFGLYGCATPTGKKWQKSGKSISATEADIHDCKVNTEMWWPFDDLDNCMHRRGYDLVNDDESVK